MSARRAAGFTLIEVLLATVLLAMGLALAFASVRSAMAISQRGEAIAAQSERMRAVQGVLRRQLAGMLRSPLQPLDPAREPLYFQGEADAMHFVAEVPAYLGRGGPYVHALEAVPHDGALRLQLGLQFVQDGEVVAERPPRPPEALLDGVRRVSFRYRGIDPVTGALGDWATQWDDTRRLPVLVAIGIEPVRGPAWPELVVAVERAGQGAAP